MKKLLGGVVIAFALFYLLTQPQAAAEVVKGAGGVVGGRVQRSHRLHQRAVQLGVPRARVAAQRP